MTIVLPVSTPDRERLEKANAFILYHEQKPYAIMREPEFFAHRKDERVCRQWGTNHPNHPYIKVIYEPQKEDFKHNGKLKGLTLKMYEHIN